MRSLVRLAIVEIGADGVLYLAEGVYRLGANVLREFREGELGIARIDDAETVLKIPIRNPEKGG